jgi:hypothetical protein
LNAVKRIIDRSRRLSSESTESANLAESGNSAQIGRFAGSDDLLRVPTSAATMPQDAQEVTLDRVGTAEIAVARSRQHDVATARHVDAVLVGEDGGRPTLDGSIGAVPRRGGFGGSMPSGVYASTKPPVLGGGAQRGRATEGGPRSGYRPM